MTPSPSVLHVPVNMDALIQSAMAVDGSSGVEEGEGIPVTIVSDEAHSAQAQIPSKAPTLRSSVNADTAVSIEAQRRKAYNQLRRQKKRASAATQEARESLYRPRSAIYSKYRDIPTLNTRYSLGAATVTKGSFTGKRGESSGSHFATMDDLCGQGFRYIEWDGQWVLSRL